MIRKFLTIVACISILTLNSTSADMSEDVSVTDIIKQDMAQVQQLALGQTHKEEMTDDIFTKIYSKSSKVYKGVNSYKTFKERLLTVMKLENFIDFFDRKGNCCTLATGFNRSLSGYYEGQWRLLDTSPGLQAFLSSQQGNSNQTLNNPNSF